MRGLTMKHDVFISYSHKDRNIADAICNRLEGEGIRCWYAPRNIQPGHEWAEDIIEALGESRIMVLVFTDSSNASVQVKREVSTAVSSGVTIIPFKCTNSEPSGSMQYYLSTLHWLDAMTDSLETSIARLKEECRRILGIQNTQETRETVKSAAAAKKKSVKLPIWAMITAAAAVITAIILCVVFLPKAGNDALPADTVLQTEQDQTLAVTETAGDVKTDAAGEDSGEYYDDPNNDSPGAENYLYDVSEYYSGVYKKGVCLNKYFGDPAEVIEIPEVVDGWPVTCIGDNCFEDMESIQKVILPETIETLGYRSFYGCTNLTEINLPASLKSTAGWTFAHTGLTEFIAPEGFADLGYGAFYSCESLKNVVLTPAVDSIGADTFAYLADGCTVTIPNPDVEVDIKAFREGQPVIIIAPESSYLNTYAKAMNLTFRPMQ